MDITHDHGPHDSSDPRYTDTWYWNGIDTKSGNIVWVHISWIPAQRRGQHVAAVVSPTGVRRERVDTTECLVSSLFSAEIITPWRVARIKSKVLNFDMQWEGFHDAVDFGATIQVDKNMDLKHFEGGGRVSGTVNGAKFTGSGFRDRSFGPRNVRRFGRHWEIGMIGVERDVVVTASQIWTDKIAPASPPDITYVGFSDQGKQAHYTSGISCARDRAGAPVEVRLPDQATISFDIYKKMGETYFILDPNSSPSGDSTTEPVYVTRSIYVTATSPTLGPLIGWYGEGVLWNHKGSG